MPEEIITRLRSYAIPIVFGLVGLVFLIVGGVVFLFKPAPPAASVTFQSETSPSKTTSLEQQLIVDIEGAVIQPGVYKMAPSTHIRDVLIEAGGLTDGADKTWVEKNINLASKVTDGMKIYVPRVSDQKSADASQSTSSTGDASINVNSATSQELDSLSGVGAVTAKKIIDNRPYQDLSELVSKKVVTQKVFDQIKGQLSL